jgi:hypothetical protein
MVFAGEAYGAQPEGRATGNAMREADLAPSPLGFLDLFIAKGLAAK